MLPLLFFPRVDPSQSTTQEPFASASLSARTMVTSEGAGEAGLGMEKEKEVEAQDNCCRVKWSPSVRNLSVKWFEKDGLK